MLSAEQRPGQIYGQGRREQQLRRWKRWFQSDLAVLMFCMACLLGSSLVAAKVYHGTIATQYYR